ncbi:MAG: winged helix-turn-helix domain-containing protein [Spirochaetaceae bacterium]|nr:winged helix-turn-helix domain-containing protein [Spirochaetaceae bacterium]
MNGLFQVARITWHDRQAVRRSLGPWPNWTFLTDHAHVLLCIARDPEMRLRDIADAVGITERAAQRIIAELADAGYLERHCAGRRNRYQLHPHLPLRHPLEHDHHIGELLGVLSATVPVVSASRPRTATSSR